MSRQIGVFGGTFDPIHCGHLAAAKAAAQALELDLVVFVPAGDPYHRAPPKASGADRLAMIKAAIAGEPTFVVSRVDLDRAGPTFTIDTLRDLRREFVDASFVLLLGSDALKALPTWRDPAGIAALAQIAAFARPGEALLDPGTDSEVILLPMAPLQVSATMVREAVAHGKSVVDLVPAEVAALIAERHLYEVR